MTVRSVIRTASNDIVAVEYEATGHAREKSHLLICACEIIGDLELKIEVSATSDAAGPEKQWIYLPQPYAHTMSEQQFSLILRSAKLESSWNQNCTLLPCVVWTIQLSEFWLILAIVNNVVHHLSIMLCSLPCATRASMTRPPEQLN